MILPLTFYLEPTSALVMIAGVYYGAMFGGAVTSILLGIPGDAIMALILGRVGLMLLAGQRPFGGDTHLPRHGPNRGER